MINKNITGPRRSGIKKALDTITFPIRAPIAFGRTEYRLFGLSSFSDERYDYVSKETKGYCLDVGCANNRFIREYLNGNGIGIDLYPYEGLDKNYVLKDMSKFPFNNDEFDSVTFIANINHVPRDIRDKELGEAYRCLKTGGNIIITNGNPIAEVMVHKMGFFYYDVVYRLLYNRKASDGYEEKDDELYLTDLEICSRLKNIGFKNIRTKYFYSQWMLNHMIISEK